MYWNECSISHFCIVGDLLEKLEHYVENNGLILSSERILLAVSGGADSMFLLHYFILKKIDFSVAHCNFGLRGEESDEDEDFVKDHCIKNGIDFYSQSFKTEAYAAEHGISIQMAARDLRYGYFKALCEKENFQKIATAHHKTDMVETLLLNQIRGTGLKGLEGIQAKNGMLIRPMLSITKSEISDFVREKGIPFREDKSNLSDKYHRNRLRMHVLPQFKWINPDFENAFYENASIVKEANVFMEEMLQDIKRTLLHENALQTTLSIPTLLKHAGAKFMLYHLLLPYGFNAATTDTIFKNLKSESGKQFFSKTHRICLNRDELLIDTIPNLTDLSFNLNANTSRIETPHHDWYFEILSTLPENLMEKNTCCLDYDKISWPLTLRVWKQGDKMKPLGMGGHKKVSDILIDKKISIPEKEKTWVIASDKHLLLISTPLLSEDYKVGAESSKVLRVSCDRRV